MIDRVCVQYCAPMRDSQHFLAQSFFSKEFVFTFFSFLKISDKMDTQMDTGGEEKGEEGEQEREIEPSKTLISNVSLIKKSVESKGEPRFIASVFRQVCLIYLFNRRTLLVVVSFARDLIFIVIVQNNDLSPSSSFFLSIHIYSSSSSSFLPSYHRRRTW